MFTSSSREGWRGPDVGQGSRPLPAESEMEEGGEEEGSERKGAAAARTSQVRLGFRVSGWPREDLAGLTFYVSFFFPQRRNRDSRFSPTLPFTKPP